MNEQVGWRAVWTQLRKEAPRYARQLPQLPRLLHDALAAQGANLRPELLAILAEQRRTNRLLGGLVWAGGGFVVGLLVTRLMLALGW